MTKTFTIETRIRLNDDLRNYLNNFVIDYNKVYRMMWSQMTSLNFESLYVKSSYYITYICNAYNLTKRTVNSIYRDITGRKKALMALKLYESRQLLIKIQALETKISAIKLDINTRKLVVVVNKASAKKLADYRKLKRKLYQKQRKLNRYKQKYEHLQEVISSNKYKLCFGSRKLFKAQWFLRENNFKSHKQWLTAYRKARDSIIYSVGCYSETQGNQQYQLYYDDITDNFCLKFRKENNYIDAVKYLKIHNLDFKYLRENLKQVCLNHSKPLSFRFKRKQNRWYLQVIFDIDVFEYNTRNNNGVIGLDFNKGFIEATETDSNGNIIKQMHYSLKYYAGYSNKAKSELSETIAKIIAYAVVVGKDISIENLDFSKKKSSVDISKKDKAYNNMLHSLDYGRCNNLMEYACHRNQVYLHKINPAYTSVVSLVKYGYARKLNRHQAASYVIARLGQGFTDRYESKATRLTT